MAARRSRKNASRSLGVISKESGAELEKLKQSEVVYRAKIRSLEAEVDTLKYRLDSLRKAKSTTIIRREREEVRISSPKLGRHRSSGYNHRSSSTTPHGPGTLTPLPHPPSTPPHSVNHEEVIHQLKSQVDNLNAELLSEKSRHEKLYEELKLSHEQESSRLREHYEQQLAKLVDEIDTLKQHKTQADTKSQSLDNLLLQLERLKTENSELSDKLEELISANKALRNSNELLQGKCETLLEDLSVKEAKWSEREEMLTAEIRKKWGERYHEWITKAEKKMEELQQINIMLQGMLKTKQHNPDL